MSSVYKYETLHQVVNYIARLENNKFAALSFIFAVIGGTLLTLGILFAQCHSGHSAVWNPLTISFDVAGSALLAGVVTSIAIKVLCNSLYKKEKRLRRSLNRE